MTLRIAIDSDIAGMHAVRTSVQENRFYVAAGWCPAGSAPNGETRFEMSAP